MMRQAFRCSLVALVGSALFAAASAVAFADAPLVADSPAPPAASPAPDASAAPAVASPAPAPTAAITVPQPGTHGLTAQFWNYGFSSFCGLSAPQVGAPPICGTTPLGPWDIQSLQYQWPAGKYDIPSVTTLLRQDHDLLPTHSQAWYADDYHTFSNSFYAYAQVGYSAGNVVPNSTYYLEGDAKFCKLYQCVLGVGYGTANNPSGAFFPFQGASTTQYLSFGPSYYYGPFALTIRFEPSRTNGTGTASTVSSVQYTNVGHDQTVFTWQTGSQPNVFVGTPLFAPIYQYQHFNVYQLIEKHWVTRSFGFLIGGLYGAYNGNQAPTNTYNQSAITYGLFWYPSP